MPKKISRRSLLTGIAAGAGTAVLACYRPANVKTGYDGDPTRLGLGEASAAIERGELSPVDLTRACLARIERIDPQLNSFITVSAEQAMADARQAESEIANGRRRGPMHGVPIAVKDNVDTKGIRTTAASKVFADRVPVEDAEVIKKLKAAGAVILGKLNMHEFAQGTTSAISHFGPVHNPWNVEYIAGGSSGGSGAAVAAGLCFGAVGTDTGGSIRIPSACCGIVGLKPTFGVVSADGTIPVSRSFDHVGPMCRTVTDTAIMFRAMTDHPAAQEYSANAATKLSGLRVGVLGTSYGICDSPVEPEVKTIFDAALDVVRSLVGSMKEAELPMPDLGGIIDFESYEYHAKYLSASPQLYDLRTRDMIMPGQKISEKDYLRMLSDLEKHRLKMVDAFANVDIVVLPTLPGLPILIGDAKEPFSLSACTFAFSMGGLPAISVPCGFSRSGLPVGMLIGGPPLSEGRLLALGAAYEKAAGWDKRRPQL